MKNTTLILTEKRSSSPETPPGAVIRQAVNIWLTKELHK